MASSYKNTYIISVHGTFAGPEFSPLKSNQSKEFYRKSSPFAQKLLKELPGAHWQEFTWNGKNLESERLKAAKKLSLILKSRFSSDSNLIFLAHSHGGNVAKYAISDADLINTNQILYSFGTPYIRTMSKSVFFEVLKRVVFDLLLIVWIASIALSPFLYDLFGLDFYDDSQFTFAEKYVVPAGVILISAILLFGAIFKPITGHKFLRRFKPDKLSANLPRILPIYHLQDEAIAALKTEAHIEIPSAIFSKPVNKIIQASVLIYFYFRFLSEIISKGISDVDIDFIWLAFKVAAINSLALLILLGIPGFIIYSFVRDPINKYVARFINETLRHASTGQDSIHTISISTGPELAAAQKVEFQEDEALLITALERTGSLANSSLIENKSKILGTLIASNKDIFEVISSSSQIANSLVHCNYFTDEMAKFLASNIKRNVSPQQEQSLSDGSI